VREMKPFCLLVLFLLTFSNSVFSAPFPKKFFVGEKLIYQIHYLGIPIGESVSEIKEIIEWKGRRAYHIQVKVKSYRAIDLVYKVRDEHHSYVDVETLASLHYEKNLREGRHRAIEKWDYDQEKKVAHNLLAEENASNSTREISPLSQDQLSCGYLFRTLELKPESSVFIPVHAEGKNWNMEVKVHKKSEMEIENIGRFDVLEVEPIMEFQGVFVKRGKIRGWMSLDKNRIPLKMKVTIPVLGAVVAQLKSYEPGKES
jgi:hypothetical protein